MVLKSLPGVGANLAKKLTDHFGTEERVMQLLCDGQTEIIAEVEGVSQTRADNIARSLNGIDGFLATKEAVRLHKELLANIANYACNSGTKSRLKNLMPVKNPEERRNLIAQAMQTDYEIRNLKIPTEIDSHFERVVVSKEPIDELKRYCRVLTPSAEETWKDYKVFKSVTWVGEDGPSQVPDGWLVLPENASIDMILPERCVKWFETNKSTLQLLSNLPEGDGFLQNFAEIRIPSIGPLLQELSNNCDADSIAEIRDQLWPLAKKLETQIHNEVDESMQNVKMDLSGADMLQALADAASLQRKLAQQTNDAIEHDS